MFSIRVDVYHHGVPSGDDRLDQILAAIQTLTQAVQAEEKTLAGELAALQAQVTQNTQVEESAVTLIKGLADQIAALKTDPAALQALSDSLKASAGDLSTAITANTPAQ
jgi:chromosome segregation ATPase